MPQASLGKVLAQLGSLSHPNLLAGTDGFEDAGVYRLDDERALVQTLDFFPPICDDPRWFGRIAAANSLSDVYAMGGRVLTAMNIVGWPKELDPEILGEILAGGMDKIREAGGALCGGHSVVDQEIKYGLSVTGIVHPDKFWRNGGAKVGDVLILSKPLGMGTVSTAIKKSKASDDLAQRAMEQMAELNKASAEALVEFEVHAATDITGFGLFGHSVELGDNSNATVVIDLESAPVIEGAMELANQEIHSGGSKRGRAALGDRVQIAAGVDEARVRMFFDAETSGGLLVALPESQVDAALVRLRDAGAAGAGIVGHVRARGDAAVVVG